MSVVSSFAPSIRLDNDGVMQIHTPFFVKPYLGGCDIVMPVVGGCGISSDVTCMGAESQRAFWRFVDMFKSFPVKFIEEKFSESEVNLTELFAGLKELGLIPEGIRDSEKLADIYNYSNDDNMFRFLLSTYNDDHLLRFNGNKEGKMLAFLYKGPKEPTLNEQGEVELGIVVVVRVWVLF